MTTRDGSARRLRRRRRRPRSRSRCPGGREVAAPPARSRRRASGDSVGRRERGQRRRPRARRRAPTTTIRPPDAGDRLDPLGRVAQDQARDAEPGRLALDAAGVGQDRRGVELERERRPVALRLDDADVRPQRDARRRSSATPRPRMERQDRPVAPGAASRPRSAAQARIAAGSRFSARWTVANR